MRIWSNTQEFTKTFINRNCSCNTILNSVLVVLTTRSRDSEVIRKTILPNVCLSHAEVLSQVLGKRFEVYRQFRMNAILIANKLELVVNNKISNNLSRRSNASVEVTYRSNLSVGINQSYTNNSLLTHMLEWLFCVKLNLEFTCLRIDGKDVSRLIISTILNECVIVREASFLQF